MEWSRKIETYKPAGRACSAALLCLIAFVSNGYGQTEMKRERGESFYRCISSNTAGPNDLWLTLSGVGNVWDDVPSSVSGHKGFWVSNFRAFPEARLQAGITDYATVSLDTRPLSWHFAVPGWISSDVKLTIPNNKNLRLFGFGLDLKYLYNFINTTPTLGGYTGFMPEGYVAKGSVIEGRFLFDADLISRVTDLPLRALVNAGVRLPLGSPFRDHYQFLVDAGIAYSGYDYDFFAAYSLEAFNNFFGPRTFTDGKKRFLVWFKENPMYLILGGNVRYKSGMTLSVAVPLLLSVNAGSAMTLEDQIALNHLDAARHPYIAYEVAHGIKDAFDPWYAKWKVAGSISFPIKYKMTSAEMMRNFLLLKNTRQQNKLDIDSRLRNFEQSTSPEPVDDSVDEQRRLEEIRKRKEEMQKQE